VARVKDRHVAQLTTGNVAAIRTLLVREEQKDPRVQALALFEQMAARWQ
jgi:hypothetical protein